MQAKIKDRKRFSGLSIFHRLLISFLGVGITIGIVSAAIMYFDQRKVVYEEIVHQFSNALSGSIDYFDKIYFSRSKEDLHFINESSVFNSFLGSQKEDMLLSKPLVEQLFLHFTDREQGVYLSARFIDLSGKEKIITSGNKRLRGYISLDSLPVGDVLYANIYKLFNRLKSEDANALLFQGPFKYGGKSTFLIGSSKREPEVGGIAGVVIFHCDLTDYFDHLYQYEFYNEYVASVYTLDGEKIFSPKVGGLLKKDSHSSFYNVSETIKIGKDDQGLIKVVFSLPKSIFASQLINIYKILIFYIFIIVIFTTIAAYIISKQFSLPLESLVVSANRLAKGDLLTRVGVKAKGEIGVLVDSFNKMVEDLSRQSKELKSAQDKLIRSEKLSAVGQLASSVAHELRNPLGVIKNALYYFNMIGLGKDNPDVKENLDIISQEVGNSDKIIGDLLEFSRVKAPSLVKENINLIIKESLSRIKIPSNVEIITLLEESLPKISADALQLQQVFYNLASNAVQAMDNGGKLTVKTNLNDDFIEVSFSDTGCGIPEENLKKIFEPLFSTKTKGTGLGLSVCASLVEGHAGKIDVESQPGKGTVFTVRLPKGENKNG